MPNTVSTPTFSSARTSAWAPVICSVVMICVFPWGVGEVPASRAGSGGRHRVPVTGEGLFSWARRATKNPRRRGAVEGRRAGRGTWSACAPTKYYEDGGGALHVPTFADVRPSVKSVDYLSQISRRIPPPGRGQPGSGRGTPPDGACLPRFVRTSDSTRPAAIGRATRKPWPLGQPIS